MYHTPTHQSEYSITIRLANGDDLPAVRRLAERDSARVPSGKLLIAIAGGELLAAISIPTGETIADPFRRSAELVGLLLERASQLRGRARRGLRGQIADALSGREHRDSLAPQPAGTLRAFD